MTDIENSDIKSTLLQKVSGLCYDGEIPVKLEEVKVEIEELDVKSTFLLEKSDLHCTENKLVYSREDHRLENSTHHISNNQNDTVTRQFDLTDLKENVGLLQLPVEDSHKINLAFNQKLNDIKLEQFEENCQDTNLHLNQLLTELQEKKNLILSER